MSDKITEAQLKRDDNEDEMIVDLDNDTTDDDIEDESLDTTDEADQGDEDKLNLPEKFKGKSISDIVAAYENLEKEYGRRGNEVGELRKLTDKLLKLEPPSKKPDEVDDEFDADSLLENPKEAISKAISEDPTIKEIRENSIKSKRDSDLKVFESKHPDWKTLMGSEQFLDWVAKSPMRLKALAESDANYDYDTGAALLDDFKAVYKIESEAADTTNAEDKRKRDQALKDVTTETKSKTKQTRRKIYSRAQIIKLKMENPAEYERRADEFQQAYAEGRVK
jgi:hypothetical protein